MKDTGPLTGDIVNTMKVLVRTGTSVSFDCAKLHVIRVDVDNKPATYEADGKYLKVKLAFWSTASRANGPYSCVLRWTP